MIFLCVEYKHQKKEGIISADLTLPIQKLFENSVVTDQMDVIYDSSGEPRKALYFIVARDIYVSNDIHLEASFVINSCTTSNSETTTEPQTIELDPNESAL